MEDEDRIQRPLGGDYVIVEKRDISPKRGTLFIEARIRDDLMEDPHQEVLVSELQRDLEKQLSASKNTFELLEDILVDERAAKLRLDTFYELAKDTLQSLKVVEYLGPKTNELNFCFTSDNVRIKVQVYAVYHTPRSFEEETNFPEGEITKMPHAMFEGTWDELVFEDDVKGDLIWMMTNLLRFSQRFDGERGDMNPLVLLYGPPGTGKTTLCQGLAQKISIRLNSMYKATELIEIKTATILSKYYSESAKQVDKIFRKVGQMCQENPETFVCVLIDEVETIAASRQDVMQRFESQDSLRATNALLTGLDRTRNYPNVMFLCTSNMVESLDSAFLDRCGLRRSIDPPSLASQYEILRSRTQKLIVRGIIQSQEVLPVYELAALHFDVGPDRPGSQLLAVVKLIRSGNVRHAHGQSGTNISGRSLTQLPEQAILRYLREEECDLDLALSFFKQFVEAEQSQAKTKDDQETNEYSKDDTAYEKYEGIELRGKKRKLKILLEADSTIEELENMLADVRRCQPERVKNTDEESL